LGTNPGAPTELKAQFAYIANWAFFVFSLSAAIDFFIGSEENIHD
jgi:hypothetical protein